MGYLTDKARELLLAGTLNLKTDDIYFVLLNASGGASKDTEYLSEVVANEVSGTGYTGGYGGAGRKSIGATGDRTVTHSGSTHKASLDVVDPTWTGANFGTVGEVLTIKKGTSDADSLVISYDDITDVVTNGGDWTYAIAAAGLWTLA
jgi:hypothetical protein